MTETELLRNAGTIEQFKIGQPVFSQHEQGNVMYVVLKGTFGVYIDTFTGFPNRVAGISQGSFFGEMALIDGSPRSASIVSEEDGAVVVVIGKDNFDMLLQNAPVMTANIISTLYNRVVVTAVSVSDTGRTAPKMPPPLSIEECKSADSIINYMAKLTDSLRKMNSILAAVSDSHQDEKDIIDEAPEDIAVVSNEISSVPGEVSGVPEEFEDSADEQEDVDGQEEEVRPTAEKVKLLPDGYEYYKITDLAYNTNSLREVGVVCPYCYKSIKTFAPIYGNLGKMEERLDGRVIYSKMNILLYANTICPNCKYCDTNVEFSIPRSALKPPKFEGNQFKNAEDFYRFDRPLNRTIDEAILSYYMNIESLKRTTNDPLKFANAWIRLYWLYSDQGSDEFAEQAAAKARQFYSRYSNHGAGNMGIDDRMRLNAILGELSYVLKDYERAFEEYNNNIIIAKDTKSKFFKQCVKRCEELKKLK